MKAFRMNRLTCVATSFLLLAELFLGVASLPTHAADELPKAAAGPANVAKDLVGTWILTKAQTPGNPSGIGTRLKFYTGTHWMITQPDGKSGVVAFHHGGRYTIDGNSISSTVDFANSNTSNFIGKTLKFKITIEGDTYTQVAEDNQFTETWKRVK